MRRHERPLARTNPSGRKVWVARYTDRHGKRRSAGTFELRREAQDAIDSAYTADEAGGPELDVTVGGYAEKWTDRNPRSPRTDRAYNLRVRSVLDVKLERRPFGDWPMAAIRPRHVNDLIDHMLRKQGRAASGATTVLRALSSMWSDAIHDDAAHYNPFRDATVRMADPRVQKAPRRIHLWSWEEMHTFAAAAPGVYGEAMIRCLSDCGLRLGEMLALERADLSLDKCDEDQCRASTVPHVHIVRTAYQGEVEVGTKTTRGKAAPGRVVPLPDELIEILRALPARLDTRLLFPSPRGQVLQNNCFYRETWTPARRAVPGMEKATPHEFRHAWVSTMRAGGVDPADAADAAGHSVETQMRHYTHPLRTSFEEIRRLIGGTG